MYTSKYIVFDLWPHLSRVQKTCVSRLVGQCVRRRFCNWWWQVGRCNLCNGLRHGPRIATGDWCAGYGGAPERGIGRGKKGRNEAEEAKQEKGKAISSAILLRPLPPPPPHPASTSHGWTDRGPDKRTDEDRERDSDGRRERRRQSSVVLLMEERSKPLYEAVYCEYYQCMRGTTVQTNGKR